MRVIILGAAAGGGLPQWNCGCKNCNDARAGVIPALSQSSIAVSADNEHWTVFNASPDIRSQFERVAAMHPGTLRESPIASMVLTNGDIDHVAGLLVLRESSPFKVFATKEILGHLAENPVFDVLNPDFVARQPIAFAEKFSPSDSLEVEAFAVPGKVPLYQEGEIVDTKLMSENTIALDIQSENARLIYAPGCAEIRDELIERAENADMLLFDGTVWQDDDMHQTGTGQKTGTRMGHVAMTGSSGSMAQFEPVQKPKKVYIHINNTNPVLQPKGAERAQVEKAGWTIGQDGMEFEI